LKQLISHREKNKALGVTCTPSGNNQKVTFNFKYAEDNWKKMPKG